MQSSILHLSIPYALLIRPSLMSIRDKKLSARFILCIVMRIYFGKNKLMVVFHIQMRAERIKLNTAPNQRYRQSRLAQLKREFVYCHLVLFYTNNICKSTRWYSINYHEEPAQGVLWEPSLTRLIQSTTEDYLFIYPRLLLYVFVLYFVPYVPLQHFVPFQEQHRD